MSINEKLLSLIYRADVNGLRQHISQGFGAFEIDRDGRNALMHALLCDNYQAEIVKLLLPHVDVDQKDKGQGWSALAFAAREGRADACALIAERAAEVDPVDSFGNTPLWRAVMARQSASIKELIKRGADPDRANNNGVSPRELAARLGVPLDANSDS